MKVYPEHGRPEGASGLPWFKVQNDKPYPEHGHPEGASGLRWLKIR